MFEFITKPEFVINTAIAILGILIPMFYEHRAKKFREISYTVEKIVIGQQDTNIKDLAFNYKGKVLESINVSDVIVWSSGKEVINKGDVASKEPLSIQFSQSVDILDAQIIHVTEKCNLFQIKVKDNIINIDYEYIGKNQGVAIRVIHTNIDADASVVCKIKDGKKVYHVGKRYGFFYQFFNHKWVKYVLSQKWMSLIFVFFTVFLFPHAFVQSSNYAVNNQFKLPEDSFFMNLDSFIILIMYLFSLILSVPHIRNLFKREVPKELLKYTICEK